MESADHRTLEIAVVTTAVSEDQIEAQPWVHGREELRSQGIEIRMFRGKEIPEAFARPFDGMLLHLWQNWLNRRRFDPYQIMPVLERQAVYRLRFPQTAQLVLNHSDESRRPFCLPYWRPGDAVLYRTPPYDRKELDPIPADAIWPYEMVWGQPCFAAKAEPRYGAGFIGTPTGPAGYRARVARETAKVGIGICRRRGFFRWTRPVPYQLHNLLMSRCRIIVCPRGWGQQSSRHWNAWFSGKAVLTDRDCDSVEMIPGTRLENGVHYLVFDDPAEIPDLVSDWTQPSRLDDLAQVAENGRRAAQSYDAVRRIAIFFRRAVAGARADTPLSGGAGN